MSGLTNFLPSHLAGPLLFSSRPESKPLRQGGASLVGYCIACRSMRAHAMGGKNVHDPLPNVDLDVAPADLDPVDVLFEELDESLRRFQNHGLHEFLREDADIGIRENPPQVL